MEIKKAAFNLSSYEIQQVRMNFLSSSNNELNVSFDVNGEFNPKESTFFLFISFSGYDATDESKQNELIFLRLKSTFQFENVNTIEQIPEYFYRNAIAILFPYLRSFVSNITLQSNSKTIILPLMNLSSLAPQLQENTKTIQ